MREIDGQMVYTELGEVVDPRHTVLLVIDLQGDYEKEVGAERVLENLPPLLATARKAGVTIIYTHNIQYPNHACLAPSQLRRMLESGYDPGTGQAYYLDPFFNQIVAVVAPQESERVIPKTRANAFVGTELEVILRSSGIQTLVFTGKATDQCVSATLWDAMGKDYYTVLVEDCVSSNRATCHQGVLEQMKNMTDVISGRDLIRIWDSSGE